MIDVEIGDMMRIRWGASVFVRIKKTCVKVIIFHVIVHRSYAIHGSTHKSSGT